MGEEEGRVVEKVADKTVASRGEKVPDGKPPVPSASVNMRLHKCLPAPQNDLCLPHCLFMPLLNQN